MSGVRSLPVQAAEAFPVSAGEIAARAAECLLLELETWPKPGLVSHVDRGSHDDMDAGTFRRSVAALAPYLHALAAAGADGRGMEDLRRIGLDAEAAMLAATAGVNTHRGALFGLGLLCAAAGARAGGRTDRLLSLGAIVAALWRGGIVDGPRPLGSHGGRALRRFGAGGARMEAARGFPSIYTVGLPALRLGARIAPGDDEAARVQACFALIAAIEDTNLLHRGGLAGLRFAQSAARRFLDDGGVGRPRWREHALSIHERFVVGGLSPGGAADLLAMTLFVEQIEGVEDGQRRVRACPA